MPLPFETDPVSDALAILITVLPIVVGSVLLLLYDRGNITLFGMVMIGGGILVGAAMVLLRWDWR